MKKLIFSLAVALATTASAFAGEMSGIISAIDPDNYVLIMEDGTEVDVSEDVDVSTLEEGMNVNIMTNDDGLAVEVAVIE